MSERMVLGLRVSAAMGEVFTPGSTFDSSAFSKTVTVTVAGCKLPAKVVAVETSPDGSEAVLTIEVGRPDRGGYDPDWTSQ